MTNTFKKISLGMLLAASIGFSNVASALTITSLPDSPTGIVLGLGDIMSNGGFQYARQPHSNGTTTIDLTGFNHPDLPASITVNNPTFYLDRYEFTVTDAMLSNTGSDNSSNAFNAVLNLSSGYRAQIVSGWWSDASMTTLEADGTNFTTSLAAGKYTLQISGTVVGGATPFGDYSGQVLVSAVPEPESYAMLLAGLGFMGFVTRRRLK